MSRSNPQPQKLTNPAKPFFFEWGGREGIIRHFDKTTNENVITRFPFGFILLDELSTISGFSKRENSGIFSNEVRDVTKGLLTVKTHAEKGVKTLVHGLYSSIKEEIKAQGGNFAASCYIAFRETAKGSLRIGNIRFAKSSLMPWIDFRSKNRAEIYNKAISINRGQQKKTGSNEYYEPTFKLCEISDNAAEEAVTLDRTLQAFMEEYLGRVTSIVRDLDTTSPELEEEAVIAEIEQDDIPF